MTYYAFGALTLLILGIIMTPLGYLIGRSLWGRKKLQADRLEALNQTLLQKKEALAGDQIRLEQLLEEKS